MQQPAARMGNPAAGVVTALGGVVLIIGSLLGWLTITATSTLIPAPLSQTIKGIDGNGGKVVLAVGILLLVAGILLVVNSSARKGLGIAALILGLIGAGIAVYNIATKTSQVNDAIKKGLEQATGRSVSDAQMAQIKSLLHLDTSAGIGIYLTIVGGVIGIAGGAMAMAGGSGATVPVGAGAAGFGVPSAPPAGAGPAPSAPSMPPFPAPSGGTAPAATEAPAPTGGMPAQPWESGPPPGPEEPPGAPDTPAT